jgi:hypothetical protein
MCLMKQCTRAPVHAMHSEVALYAWQNSRTTRRAVSTTIEMQTSRATAVRGTGYLQHSPRQNAHGRVDQGR